MIVSVSKTPVLAMAPYRGRGRLFSCSAQQWNDGALYLHEPEVGHRSLSGPRY